MQLNKCVIVTLNFDLCRFLVVMNELILYKNGYSNVWFVNAQECILNLSNIR